MTTGPQGTIERALAIEASSRPTSIALHANGHEALRVLEADRAHASDLVPAIDELLREHGVDSKALELVVVGTGPGSYTGLRVAAAAALGIRLGAGAQLVGVPSFAAIARAGLEPGERGTVLRDAFGGHVYGATYERTKDGELSTVREPWCEEATALRESGALDGAIVMADARAIERTGIEPSAFADVRDVPPRANELLTLGLDRFAAQGADGPEGVRPLYLRPFGA